MNETVKTDDCRYTLDPRCEKRLIKNRIRINRFFPGQKRIN